MTALGSDATSRDVRTKLVLLWVFVSLNYVYGDVFAILGKTVGVTFTPTSLLGAAALVETPIVMIVLSWGLGHRMSRWANIGVGAVNALASLSSLVVGLEAGTASFTDGFFAIAEIAAAIVIVRYAWCWHRPGLHG